MLTTTDLIGLLNAYGEAQLELAGLTSSYQALIRQIQSEQESDPNVNAKVQEIDALGERIRIGAAQLEGGAKGKIWRVVYSKGATRRSWDLDALDDLRMGHPDIWQVIEPFRVEATGQPQVRLEKIKEKAEKQAG